MSGYDYGVLCANSNVNWNRYGVVRIALESLDAALEVCNSLGHFGENKIFDVFDQTFPTAFVLNTGYWIFYVSNYGASLCVCGRFGIVCRHVRSKNHWIDLQPLAERSGAIVFIPKIYGPVIPTITVKSIDSVSKCVLSKWNKVTTSHKKGIKNYGINVKYLSETLGYMIDIDMDLAYANMCKQNYHVHIQARYGYANQWYGAPYSIRFTPNPVLKEQYGKYFKKLRNHQLFFISKYGHEDLFVTPTTMPPACLLLISVNVAKHEVSSSVTAILMNDSRLSTGYSRDVSTQTIDNEDLSHYANLLHDVTTRIWGYHDNTESKFPMIEEFLENSLPPYTEIGMPEYPIGIYDPEEYDIQFPEFSNRKSIYKGHRASIAEKSIPKPISSVVVQNSTSKPRTEKLRSTEKISLPNFEDTFLNQEPIAPVCESTSKRKRGRPKHSRADEARAYSLITKSAKELSSFEKNPSSSVDAACDKADGLGNVTERKQETNYSFSRLSSILDQSNEIGATHQVKDVNFELDIIEQLIREDSAKNGF